MSDSKTLRLKCGDFNTVEIVELTHLQRINGF